MPIRLDTPKAYASATLAHLDAIQIDLRGPQVTVFVSVRTEADQTMEQIALSSAEYPGLIADLNNGPGGTDVARQLRRNLIAFLVANRADLVGTEEGE